MKGKIELDATAIRDVVERLLERIKELETRSVDIGAISFGATLILEERIRQVETEGWNEVHDDEHTDQSLIFAALCYAMPEKMRGKKKHYQEEDIALRGECSAYGKVTYDVPKFWPESWNAEWWKPENRIRDLVKAGALIAAEIDRLQRVES